MSIKFTPEDQKLLKKWNKILRKQGLRTIDSMGIPVTDKIVKIINSYKTGLDDLQDNGEYWDNICLYYWNYYEFKDCVLDRYVQGYKVPEIRNILHISYKSIHSKIRRFKRYFKKHLPNLRYNHSKQPIETTK